MDEAWIGDASESVRGLELGLGHSPEWVGVDQKSVCAGKSALHIGTEVGRCRCRCCERLLLLLLSRTDIA